MNRPGQNGKHQRGDQTSSKPEGGKDRLRSLRGVLRHHNDEDGQDGDCADVHEDLREADELRAQLQIERGQSGKAQGEGQHAMH